MHDVLTYTRLHPAANTPYSNEILTYAPENILMLFRHGRAVLKSAGIGVASPSSSPDTDGFSPSSS